MKRLLSLLLMLCLLAGCSKEVERGPVRLVDDPPVPEYYEVSSARLQILDVIDGEFGAFKAMVLEAEAEINLLETAAWIVVQAPPEMLLDDEQDEQEIRWKEWHKHSKVEIENATYDATNNTLYLQD